METVVVSDLHLSDAESEDPKRPLWKAYKWRRYFIDADFIALLDHVESQAATPIELVLNGDIFDFDNITQLPTGHFSAIDRLSRLRGLSSEEWMSLFKIGCIIADHGPWFERLGKFVRAGNRVVFVIGNHDVELQWPRIQQRIREAMGYDTEPVEPTTGGQISIRFCEWFYVSQRDTYITHGHLYDPNCTVRSAIDPLIVVRGRTRVRLPFGDIAERYMLNGMGYFNPHATGNYIMSATDYVRFFLKYMVRGQPLLLWTWFWGALVTFVLSLLENWRPPLRDPLSVDEKVQTIAHKANATSGMVRQLQALNVPSACENPFRILRELWLDRGLLVLAAIWMAWQIILMINFVWPISPAWVFVPLAIFLPIFFVYAASVSPTVFTQPLLSHERAELIVKITGVRRIVMGHTHEPCHSVVGPVTYLNSGFWSPAFKDPTCTERIGKQTFVWIKDMPGDGERSSGLWEWPPGAKQPEILPAISTPPTDR